MISTNEPKGKTTAKTNKQKTKNTPQKKLIFIETESFKSTKTTKQTIERERGNKSIDTDGGWGRCCDEWEPFGPPHMTPELQT